MAEIVDTKGLDASKHRNACGLLKFPFESRIGLCRKRRTHGGRSSEGHAALPQPCPVAECVLVRRSSLPDVYAGIPGVEVDVAPLPAEDFSFAHARGACEDQERFQFQVLASSNHVRVAEAETQLSSHPRMGRFSAANRGIAIECKDERVAVSGDGVR